MALASRYFLDLTQPEIASQLKKNPLVILPQGSVEQHGPHLPAGTDIFAANVIAHAVAERMDGLVLPGGPLGVTPIHMPFESTITLSPETYIQLVVETCASMAKHGAKYLLILNWHEMNIPPLAVAADHLHRKYGLMVLTVQFVGSGTRAQSGRATAYADLPAGADRRVLNRANRLVRKPAARHD